MILLQSGTGVIYEKRQYKPDCGEKMIKTKVKLDKFSEAETPSLPNYIKVNGTFLPIRSFEERILKKIGNEWTKNLIKLSKKRNLSQTNQPKESE